MFLPKCPRYKDICQCDKNRFPLPCRFVICYKSFDYLEKHFDSQEIVDYNMHYAL